MRAMRPTQSRQRPWFHHHLLKTANRASPHYAMFSILPIILPSIPQHPISQHPQPVCISEQERPTVTSLHDTRHSHTTAHLYRYVVNRTQRHKTLRPTRQQGGPQFNVLSFSSYTQFSFGGVLPRYFTLSPPQFSLLIFRLWVSPALCWPAMKTYFIFSAFTSRPAVRLLPNKASVVFYTVFVISLNTFTLAGGVASTN